MSKHRIILNKDLFEIIGDATDKVNYPLSFLKALREALLIFVGSATFQVLFPANDKKINYEFLIPFSLAILLLNVARDMFSPEAKSEREQQMIENSMALNQIVNQMNESGIYTNRDFLKSSKKTKTQYRMIRGGLLQTKYISLPTREIEGSDKIETYEVKQLHKFPSTEYSLIYEKRK